MYTVKAEISTGVYAFNNVNELWAQLLAHGLDVKTAVEQSLHNGRVIQSEIKFLTPSLISVKLVFVEELDFYKMLSSDLFRRFNDFISTANWNLIIKEKSKLE